MKRILIIVLAICKSLYSFAQIDAYLIDYGINEQNEHVIIHWRTSAGFTCEDIKVEHGLDSNMLRSIYIYPGICGADTTEESYAYTVGSDFIYNVPNYFRINLGKYGVSKILQITVVSLDSVALKLFPNPITESSTLFFENYSNETATIQIKNVIGKIILPDIQTKKNSIKLNELNQLPAGIYRLDLYLNRKTSGIIFIVL
ncbi:MAG: T9SS type A sorting domain-containing protein [Flavobacteriales bacterium]|nr:T9SS type A sorting domain-containing protein [Flavobacteriales bacterium]